MISAPSLGFPFFVHMMNELKDEARKLGVRTVESDGQNSTPKQTADVEAAIVQGVDGIIISRTRSTPWRRPWSRRWRPASRS